MRAAPKEMRIPTVSELISAGIPTRVIPTYYGLTDYINKELDIGESAQAIIEAKKKWNDTGIELVSGQEYQFAATGHWTDWWIECDAGGYDSPNRVQKAFEGLRRFPYSRWFALIGAINEGKPIQFEIGTDRKLVMPVSGLLTCFANDTIGAYWNNSGSVQLSVTRVN